MANWGDEEEMAYPTTSNHGWSDGGLLPTAFQSRAEATRPYRPPPRGYQSLIPDHYPSNYQPYPPPQQCPPPQQNGSLYRPQFNRPAPPPPQYYDPPPPTYHQPAPTEAFYQPQQPYFPQPQQPNRGRGGSRGRGGRGSGGERGPVRSIPLNQQLNHPPQHHPPPQPTLYRQSPPKPKAKVVGERETGKTEVKSPVIHKERLELPAVDVKTIQFLHKHRNNYEILMDFYGKIDSTFVQKEAGRWEVRVRDLANQTIFISYWPIDDPYFVPAHLQQGTYIKTRVVWRWWGLQSVSMEPPAEVNFLALLPQRRALTQQLLARRLPALFAL